jgi:thiosulfate/3-mercaptopyruvate sulfurtransferase
MNGGAARLWWLLRHFGHDDVAVLEGGLDGWLGPLGRGEEAVEPAEFTPSARRGDTMEADELRRRLGDERLTIVDARAPERYRGEIEPIDPVAGRIPGAVNVPTGRNLTDDGRFRPAHELREIYAEVGAVPGADVAAYCGSGVTAVHDIVAMEIAGVRAALYPGSYSGWIADPERKVETG